jgi:hypothetical protein
MRFGARARGATTDQLSIFLREFLMDAARGFGLGAFRRRTFGKLAPPKIIHRMLISQTARLSNLSKLPDSALNIA